MTSGVESTDMLIGAGSPAEEASQVVVHARGILNRGDLFMDTWQDNHPLRIEFGKRDCIAGLRYGIIGMRVGGRRNLTVSPHLGYGAAGLPGRVPPNAMLRFEVELLEVREAGTIKADDYPPGKHLFYFAPGEISRNRPRVQFGLGEDGRCGLTATIPSVGATWRHARSRAAEQHLDVDKTVALFDEVTALPKRFPKVCLSNDDLWADASEKANSITRDSLTDIACVTFGISERGIWLCYYSLRETEPVLLNSKIFQLIQSILPPLR